MIPTWGASKGGATLALDFVNSGSLSSQVTFSRGTLANQYDSTGSLIYAPMNGVRNNTMVGAVNGTPGTVPTNWGADASTTGLSRQIVGTGVDAGITYIDYRIFGTSAAANYYAVYFESQTGIAALSGQQWTGSYYIKLAAGSTAGLFSSPGVGMNENTGAGIYVTGGKGAAVAPTSSWQRATYTRPLVGGATVGCVIPYLIFDANNGGVIDITLRIGMPQLELGSVATTVNATSGTAYYGPRFDYDPSSYAYQNLLLYSEQFNNAAWVKANVSITPDAAFAPNGTTTMDALIESTSNSQHYVGNPTFSAGTYTFSVYVKAMSLGRYICLEQDNVTDGSSRAIFDPTTGANTFVTASTTATSSPVGNGIYRVTVSATKANASTYYIYITNSATTILGYTGDGTSGIYIWGAQVNAGSTALPYYATTSAAYTQCVPQGLLIEEARTNSIRNNTMQGAAAGTPGTLPTNWVVGNTAGLTTSVVGTGTQNGVTYIDIKAAGTTTGGQFTVLMELNTQVAAVSGQSWTTSAWVSTVGGSGTNITSYEINTLGRTSVGATSESGATLFTPSSVLVRQNNAFTLASVTTAYVTARIAFNCNTGVAIDITLRIGLPQLELGAFATSVIPTFGSTATRNADVASMTGTNFSSWYNATQGTLYAEYSRFAAVNFQTVAYLGTPAQTDYIALLFGSAAPANNQRFDVGVGGVSQASISVLTTPALNTISKTIGAYALNDFAATANGAAPGIDTAGTVPTVSSIGIGTGTALTGPYLNGWIRSIRYYPTRLSNSAIQALTV